ncbi:hypothetical protein AV929_07140 [Haloarcula sp. K1]|nr:hypothetical protein AV929_07140 [Haloarcula sp. K1]
MTLLVACPSYNKSYILSEIKQLGKCSEQQVDPFSGIQAADAKNERLVYRDLVCQFLLYTHVAYPRWIYNWTNPVQTL